jgi:predicted flap endonuclease-1-like 5' DNA nuclease
LKNSENYLNSSAKIDGLGEKNMRSDYALYAVAIIFFIITVISVGLTESLWVVTTAVLGFLFAGLGYTQRPKPQAIMSVETPPSTSAPTPVITPVATPAPTPEPMAPTVAEPLKEEKIEVPAEPAPSVLGLTEVKGIGEKRKEQLNALGINSVEDLAKASADELATKLKVSPKITVKWIENAKRQLKKS